MMRSSKYDAFRNRMRVGSFSKFGTLGSILVERGNAKDDGSRIWFEWRPHPCIANRERDDD